MSSKMQTLQKSIADTISDYRSDEGFALDRDHVEAWINQFDPEIRLATLSELDHVLKKTYFSKNKVGEFLKSLAQSKELTKGDPRAFWKDTGILAIQKRGNSQGEMLSLFDRELGTAVGFGVEGCNGSSNHFVYLDDGIFSGNHVVNDFEEWITSEAPKKGTVHIVVIALHSGGCFYARRRLQEIASKVGKTLEFTFWRVRELENFSNCGAAADVLRLKTLPDDDATREYLENVFGDAAPAVLRPRADENTSKVFSGEEGRNSLEQTLWSQGLTIRQMCPNLKPTHRPLGYTSTNSANKLGFGSTTVMYRNCPNNCPLAFWAGDPWYPLLERKTNR